MFKLIFIYDYDLTQRLLIGKECSIYILHLCILILIKFKFVYITTFYSLNEANIIEHT